MPTRAATRRSVPSGRVQKSQVWGSSSWKYVIFWAHLFSTLEPFVQKLLSRGRLFGGLFLGGAAVADRSLARGRVFSSRIRRPCHKGGLVCARFHHAFPCGITDVDNIVYYQILERRLASADDAVGVEFLGAWGSWGWHFPRV